MIPDTDKVRVLHVASFLGNVGDSAMHDGAYRTRREDCPLRFEYTPLEVREFFHWKMRRFDEDFVRYLNGFDLSIFGGLAGYQLWRTDTASGTCFNFGSELIEKMTKPVAFYGLGCDASRGIEEGAMVKFRRFIDAAMEKNCLFSLRNDGSKNILEQAVGTSYIGPMPVIPDGGLFVDPKAVHHQLVSGTKRIVAINLAGCMPDMRFAAAGGENFSTQKYFVKGMADIVCDLIGSHSDVRVVFVPHIYSDFDIISQVLGQMSDESRRRHVSVAPYLNGGENWSEIFDIYRQAELVIGMRFHACAAAIGLGTQVIGVDTHHKISGLFADLQIDANCISLVEANWLSRLKRMAQNVLQASHKDGFNCKETICLRRKQLHDFHQRLANWYLNSKT